MVVIHFSIDHSAEQSESENIVKRKGISDGHYLHNRLHFITHKEHKHVAECLAPKDKDKLCVKKSLTDV